MSEMKLKTRKLGEKILSVLIVGSMISALSGCSAVNQITEVWDNDIASTVNESVTMPDQYSISYEVEAVTGEIHTVTKTVDSNGNIYFQFGMKELLFIAEGSNYVLYERDSDGSFTAANSGAVYNKAYVNSVTGKFTQYVEKSRIQYMPGMENVGEQKMLDRTCFVYSASVGTGTTSMTYSMLVDEETGICVSWEESKKAAGRDLDVNSETFRCTTFVTEDIPNLKEQL